MPHHPVHLLLAERGGLADGHLLLGTGGLPRGVSASFRGARSSGKTALALEALKTFDGNHHIVPVRGSAISAKVPYAALGYLLSELPEHVLDHPVLAMQGRETPLADWQPVTTADGWRSSSAPRPC